MNRTLLVRLVTVLTLLVAAASVGYGHGTVAESRDGARPGVQANGDDRVWISTFVFRTVDEEAGVVCYVTELPEGAGIDCVPIGQTRLAPDGRRTPASETASANGSAPA